MKKQSIIKINLILSLISLLTFPLNVFAWNNEGDRTSEVKRIANRVDTNKKLDNSYGNIVVLGSDKSLEEIVDELRKDNIKVMVIVDDNSE